jgi:hypothetical protein
MHQASSHRTIPPTRERQTAVHRLAMRNVADLTEAVRWAIAYLMSLASALDTDQDGGTHQAVCIEVAGSLPDLAGWGDWATGYAIEVADAITVEVPAAVRLAAAVLHDWAVDLAEPSDHAGATDLTRAKSLAVPLRCDFRAREVPGPSGSSSPGPAPSTAGASTAISLTPARSSCCPNHPSHLTTSR